MSESSVPASAAAPDGPLASPWSRRATWIAFLAIALVWAAAASAWPLTGKVVPWDSKNHFYPMLRYLSATLANGEWPLWNPFHFSGHPTVADPQSLLFTPLMAFLAWLVPNPSMQLFDVAVFAHLLIGALAIGGLFRRRDWHPAGAVLAATVFILGGSAAARLQHTGIIFSYGILPLALLLMEVSLARRSHAIGVLFAVAGAILALGRDQIAFFGCIILVGAFLAMAFRDGRPLPFLRERAGVLSTIVVIALAILAVPVLLTLQFLAGSNRPEIGYGIAAMGSLPLPSLATLFFPNVFGTLNPSMEYWGPGPMTMPDGSWTDRSINYVFIGTLPALLVVGLGLGARRLFRREIAFAVAVGVAALLYAAGRYTPVYQWLYDFVPGVKLYRRPADATFVLNFALAMAAGYLLHLYARDGLPRPRLRAGFRSLLAALAAAGIAAYAIYNGIEFASREGKAAFAAREIGIGLLIAAIGLVAMVAGRATPRARTIAAAAIVAVTAGEMVWRHAASGINAEPARNYAVFEVLPPEQVRGLQILKAELDRRHGQGERPRVEILGMGGAWQNASMVLGIEDTLGYNALRIADYEKAVGSGENAVDMSLRKFPGTFEGYRCRLASLLGLEYLVLDRPLARLPRHFPKIEDATLLFGEGQMWIYRLVPSAPRVYLATRLHAVDSEEALQEEELPAFDRNGEALIDTADVEGLTGDYGLKDSATDPEPANVYTGIRGYRRNAVIVHVDTDRSGVLVLHDIYYPGWEVYVDGEKKPLLRVNLLFRGVEVGPGRHKVAFRFRPLTLDNLMAAAQNLVQPADGGEGAEPAETLVR